MVSLSNHVFVCSWLLIVIASAWPAAAQETFTGRLSDSACAASHQSKTAADGLTDRDCIFACVKALAAYRDIVRNAHDPELVAAAQDRAAQLEGRKR